MNEMMTELKGGLPSCFTHQILQTTARIRFANGSAVFYPSLSFRSKRKCESLPWYKPQSSLTQLSRADKETNLGRSRVRTE